MLFCLWLFGTLALSFERFSMPHPQIVVLDGYTLNPGDLDWEEAEALGPCTIHERSAPGEVLERARRADILLTNKAVLSRETIFALPRLKYIGVMATGYNVVDVEAARERGIPVTNVPEYGTKSVAQMVFALLLELTRGAGRHSRSVREGSWSACPDYCYWDIPLLDLEGMVMGIVGYGRIGRETARIAGAFGMRTLASVRRESVPEEPGVEFVPLDALLRKSDVVSLHCPLTPETAGMINRERLALMKPGAFLINTARGGLVNESDLAEALNAGRIAGAGLDVLSTEPPPRDNPLLGARNCVITPHIAWATLTARKRLLAEVVENVRAFLRGAPRNVVNGV